MCALHHTSAQDGEIVSCCCAMIKPKLGLNHKQKTGRNKFQYDPRCVFSDWGGEGGDGISGKSGGQYPYPSRGLGDMF